MTKVILLDAVGTLFDVRGSVGEVYQSWAIGGESMFLLPL